MLESLLRFYRSSSLQHEVAKFVLPCIEGFLKVQNSFINNKEVNLILISRRQWDRAGIKRPH